jgi:hypothetical protein
VVLSVSCFENRARRRVVATCSGSFEEGGGLRMAGVRDDAAQQ